MSTLLLFRKGKGAVLRVTLEPGAGSPPQRWLRMIVATLHAPNVRATSQCSHICERPGPACPCGPHRQRLTLLIALCLRTPCVAGARN
jgi:hypothetical protein